MATTSTLAVLLRGWDDAWGRLEHRLDGLSQAEYLWKPVPQAWTVSETDGGWHVERTVPDPDPAPVTTIAWRTWHLAADCLAEYLNGFTGSPLAVGGRQWHGDVGPALQDLSTATSSFRAWTAEQGDQGLTHLLGPAWGPFAESTRADLVMHAIDELAHHGAEIALLRDLYRWSR